ncbi:diguanylate cyclase [Solibacillus sp. FSL W7-1464]|uniref:diguanylate cyclase n=1 Tax=Solibacillus sp. FSL W7-1464 TaxID=2921706 RepID=UPI0030F64E81
MFFELTINFSILFCFTILIFWPFIQYEDNPFIHKYKSIIVGVTFGCAAFILTALATPYAHGMLINNRIIFVLFSGLLGGPVSMFITGFMIVISRYVLLYTSILSFIIMLNTLVVTVIACYFALKRPITFQNLPIYFFIITIEHIIILLIYDRFEINTLFYLILYFVVSTFTFYAVRKILMQLEHKNKQIKQIYALKKTDLLTQLPNNIAIEQKLLSYVNAKIPFELLHIDIRHFRELNYMYHYKAGDEILVQISQLIKDQLPEKALIGRIDSDEFYVVLPQMAPAEAITLAYSINKSVQQLTFENYPSSELTLAIGICSFPQNGQTVKELYRFSNEALLKAKQQATIQICHYNQIKQRY